jgi:hypothetical protein
MMREDTFFILVHLPNETLCFNETIAKNFGVDYAWTILKTDIVGDNPYRAINGIFEAKLGKWVYGDKQNANIGTLDDTVASHYGEAVEWLLYSPLLRLPKMSLRELEMDTIPGHAVSEDATVAFSLTRDGLTYGNEWFEMYGEPLDYRKRFISRALGRVNHRVGFKWRGASTARMSFAGARLTYG